MLLNDDLPRDQRHEFLHAIAEAGERAASLTQQIMAFSRKQVLLPCVLDLNAVVRRMESMIRRLIGSNILFTTVLAPDLEPVKADPTQLGQVTRTNAVIPIS